MKQHLELISRSTTSGRHAVVIEDIFNVCTSAWNHFISDIQQVKTLCSRDWINMVNKLMELV